MRKLWNWFCQKMGDYHFYRWIQRHGEPEEKRFPDFDLYMKWQDRKRYRSPR